MSNKKILNLCWLSNNSQANCEYHKKCGDIDVCIKPNGFNDCDYEKGINLNNVYEGE